MKAPRFWYPQQEDTLASLCSNLLLPFSGLFKAGTKLRRACAAHPYRARVPVVCVGNVVAGGAGKTPTALALAQILKKHGHKPVFVTRGTGGHGMLTCVDPAQQEVRDVGDEALLLAEAGPTWAANDRAAAVRVAETNGSIIILDDGLQNPHIAPSASFLVVDGELGIGNGRIIPAGPLRETLAEALPRSSAMIVIGDRDRQNLAATALAAKVPVFRACLMPKLPFGFPRDGKFVAFAGIARPEKFFATARALGLDLADARDFPDHYVYSEADIDDLRLKGEECGARLLTTSKDAVRLPAEFRAEVVVLPVELVFDDPSAEQTLAELACSKSK